MSITCVKDTFLFHRIHISHIFFQLRTGVGTYCIGSQVKMSQSYLRTPRGGSTSNGHKKPCTLQNGSPDSTRVCFWWRFGAVHHVPPNRTFNGFVQGERERKTDYTFSRGIVSKENGFSLWVSEAQWNWHRGVMYRQKWPPDRKNHISESKLELQRTIGILPHYIKCRQQKILHAGNMPTATVSSSDTNELQ